MTRIPSRSRKALPVGVGLLGVVLLGAAFGAVPVHAQTFLPDPAERTAFALEWEKPFFDDGGALSGYSSIVEADVIIPLRPGRSLQIGLPLAFAGAELVDGPSAYAGNLRASLLFGDPEELGGFVGVTLPTASNVAGDDLAVIVGFLPWLNELEKWSEEVFSVRGGYLPSIPLESGGRLGLRLGGSAVMPTDFENLFVFTRVAGWGRFPTETAEFRADLGFSYDVTNDDGFGEQFTSYLAVGGTLTDVEGRPGLFIRIPLDGDARDAMDFSIGLRAQF